VLFFEPLFLFYAFPVFFAVYWAFRHNAEARRWLLILGSFAFYSWGEPLFVPVVLASALLDYIITVGLTSSDLDKWRTSLVALGIAQNLGILIFYKYIDFLLQILFTVSGHAPDTAPQLGIALPIGVSFVVFEKISALVDIYRGITPRPRNFFEYCFFVFFFPKLLAGPILKYHEVSAQITDPQPIRNDDIIVGVERFARGIVKKILLADPLGSFADQVFAPDPHLSFHIAWLGLLSFSLQIYLDFSAYSDMAIGLARMLGFSLRENFATPYLACSLTEFWRRWHISLTTWIRDYLYIPLGGSRTSALATYANLWLCFFASGLWHGAAWNFVLWGAYNGVFLTLDRMFLREKLNRINVYVANVITVLIVMFGWVIFRSTSLDAMGHVFAALLNPLSPTKTDLTPGNFVLFAVGAGVIICAFPRLPFYPQLEALYQSDSELRAGSSVALAALFVFACGRVLATSLTPFLYFRF
jgi:alginate O-acetyltransferase complex protein AlgI